MFFPLVFFILAGGRDHRQYFLSHSLSSHVNNPLMMTMVICFCGLHDLWCFIFVTINPIDQDTMGIPELFSWIVSACDAINVSLSIIIPVLKVSSLSPFHFLFTRKHPISSFMQKLFLKLDTCRRLTNMLWTLRYFRCLIRLVFPVTVLQGFTFVFLHGVVTDRILLWRKQISYQSNYLIILKDDFKL